MGKTITKENKVKFELKTKEDCVLYLGHLIEYVEKKNDVYWHLILETTDYLVYELQRKGIKINEDKEDIRFIIDRRDIDFNIDFYKFKLFNSALELIQNEIINIIGDRSYNKIAISYRNYLDILKENKIKGVCFKNNEEKEKLVDDFNTLRNFLYHFSSDKLCEWISYREEQRRKYKGIDFEFSSEFNVYISTEISYKTFISEFEKKIMFYEKIKKALQFMKKDFEELIGENVMFSIKKASFDNSAEDITNNGFKSHKLSKYKKNKY